MKRLVLLVCLFGAAFAVETTVHLSTGVASSVCQQHQDYLTAETLQPPITSRPETTGDAGESECEWLTIPKITPGTGEESGISRRPCDESESQGQGQGQGGSADGADGSGRIVGGVVTEPHEFPAFVTIFFLNEPPTDKYREFLCGGSILSENWILTAYHCLAPQKKPEFYRIVAGSFNISDPNEPAQIRDFDKLIFHPNYTGDVWNGHDMALMHMTEPLVFDDKVQKIGLPLSGYKPAAGTQVTLVARGRTKNSDPPSDVPRKANFTVVSDAGCQKAAGPYYEGNISDTVLCARVGAEVDKDACFGDSGSMVLAYGEDGVPFQVGVVSFGGSSESGEKSQGDPRLCTSYKGPFGSASVAKLSDWIKENIAE